MSTEQSSLFVNLAEAVAGLLGRKPDIDAITHVVRKAAHFTEFAAQAGCLGLFFILYFKKLYDKIIYILFTGLFSACIDEFIQLFPVGRSSQVSDVFVDFSGTAAAVLFCVLIYELKRNQR